MISRILRTLLIFSHRYLGIAISLMCVIWFASGIVMMYAGGMPRVTEQLRLERLAPLDLSQVRLTAAEAAQRLEGEGSEVRPELLTVMQRPAYRFQGRNGQTVFADNGEILQEVDTETARVIASRFLNVPADRVHFERTLDEPDQWTLNNRGDTLHKFRVDDEAGTEIYISPGTADVAQMTTSSKRALAWIGTITQFRRTRPFQWSQAIPYRGWMRWHYILGAGFGVIVLTWAFSGLMSMEPWDWTNAEGLEIGETARFRPDPAGAARALQRRVDTGAPEDCSAGRAYRRAEPAF